MILYRISAATGRFEWETTKKAALDYGRDVADAGVSCTVDKFDVPTSKGGLCDFLNLVGDGSDYDALKHHAGAETIKVFEAKEVEPAETAGATVSDEDGSWEEVD